MNLVYGLNETLMADENEWCSAKHLSCLGKQHFATKPCDRNSLCSSPLSHFSDTHVAMDIYLRQLNGVSL